MVTLRSLFGRRPVISLRRSEAIIGGAGVVDTGMSVENDEDTLGASGASIHSARRLSKYSMATGMLKSRTFGYVEIRKERKFGIRSSVPA